MSYKKIIVLSALLCLSSHTANAAVNEIIPGDYEAPRVGIKLATLYLAQKQMDGPYVQGNKLTNEKIDVLVTALKLTNTISVGGYTVCPMVALPYYSTKSDGQTMSAIVGRKSIGISDLIAGATGWLINDKPSNQYLAATLLFFAPTGKYDSKQLLNTGENRYKTTLNIGYVQKLNDDFIVEFSPEVALYGRNNDSLGRHVDQAPSYALTSTLRYERIPKTTLYGSFQQNGGGETSINGVGQHDASKTQKATLGGYYYTKGGTQILLKYGKEFGVQDGIKTTDDILLRLQWWFM